MELADAGTWAIARQTYFRHSGDLKGSGKPRGELDASGAGAARDDVRQPQSHGVYHQVFQCREVGLQACITPLMMICVLCGARDRWGVSVSALIIH